MTPDTVVEDSEVKFAFDEKSKILTGMLKGFSTKAKLIRLLAEENVTITFDARAETASCGVTADRREVTMPINVQLSDEDVFMLFSAHEVGHALWTTEEYLKKASLLKVFSSWNIVEDIRVERMAKSKWPGFAKNFLAGYKKLAGASFFGKPTKWPYLKFADRLNIYAKVGPIIGADIKFSKEELDFYHECMAAETEAQVHVLAIRLYEWSKEKKVKFSRDEDFFDLAEKFGLDKTVESDDLIDGEDKELTPEEIKKILEQEIEEFNAQDEFDKSMGRSAINNTSVIAYETYSGADVEPYSKFLEAGRADQRKERYKNGRFTPLLNQEDMRDIRRKFSRSIDIMTVQFEMKKAAWQAKNAKISKTGQLDLSRLHAYKTSEDLFRSSMSVPDAKNHGFIILLDASGSIDRMWDDMVRQTILLTEFYKKIGAHFKVVLFGACLKKADFGWSGRTFFQTENDNLESPCLLHARANSDDVVEVLSSTMSKKDYNDSCMFLLNQSGFDFGGTPMVSAMNRMETYGNKFFDSLRVTKKKIVIITDGEPTDSRTGRYIGSMIVSDQKTKKNHFVTSRSRNYGMLIIDILGKIYKDRYDIDVIPMMLVSGSSNINRSYTTFTGKSAPNKVSLADGFHQAETVMGTKVFFIKTNEVSTEVDLEDASGDIKDIQRMFKKALTGNRKSAVLMRVLADQLAM